MESRLIALVTFVFLTVAGFSQPTSFYKVFSGNGYDEAQGLTQLADSSYLITGSSSSFENAPNQAFLMNIDKQGNYLWSKAYGGAEFEEGKRVFSVDNFGHYVIGTSNSDVSHNFDAYVFFTDPSGELQWEKWFDYGSWERVHSAIMLPDTSLVAVAETDSTATGNTDFYMFRLDKNGDMIWSKKWGSSGDDLLKAINIVSDTTFVISGTQYVTDSLTNKGYVGYFKNDGTLVWDSTYCANGWAQINDIHYYENVLRGIGQRKIAGNEFWDYYNLDLDLNGNLVSDSYFNTGTGSGRFTHYIRYTAAVDKFFVIRQIEDAGFPTYPDGEDDICSRYTAQFYWDASDAGYSNGGQDNVNQIIATKDGFAAFVGSHEYYCCGGSSLFIVKIGDDSNYPYNTTSPVVYDMVGIEENNQLLNVSAYPNPFNDEVSVDLPEGETARILVYNQLGQELETFERQSGTVVLKTDSYSKGIYFFKVSSENGTATLRLVK
jgi:hypothetical protein